MIRRGFWLAVGAAGGIMGYRRASSLARQVSETFGVRQNSQNSQNGLNGPYRPNRPAAPRRHWARDTIRFARDVREGMDLYSARHPGTAPPTLGESTGNTGTRDDERVKDDR